MTIHVEEEMDDELTIFDAERAILNWIIIWGISSFMSILNSSTI